MKGRKKMAEIQDLEVVDLEADEIGEVEVTTGETVAETVKDEPVAEVPEKYRGKSPEDLIKMHQESEKLIDRQASEVGEVRRLADDLIKSQLYAKPKEEQTPAVDFFENPEEAIRHAVDNNPKVLAAEQSILQQQRLQAQSQLQQLHPDFTEIVKDTGFAEWIKSSRIRTQLYQQAENYDLDAANELLSTFKELKAVKAKQVVEVDKTVRNQSLQAAAVDTGGSNETSKKVYRRADLIRLKLSNPAKFEAMQEDIDKAYQEGRVK
jgi:hypothetical protein